MTSVVAERVFYLSLGLEIRFEPLFFCQPSSALEIKKASFTSVLQQFFYRHALGQHSWKAFTVRACRFCWGTQQHATQMWFCYTSITEGVYSQLRGSYRKSEMPLGSHSSMKSLQILDAAHIFQAPCMTYYDHNASLMHHLHASSQMRLASSQHPMFFYISEVMTG